MKLKIVNTNSEPASLFKRFIRNIIWFFGILEIISLLATKKRIGDKLAGTKVISK